MRIFSLIALFLSLIITSASSAILLSNQTTSLFAKNKLNDYKCRNYTNPTNKEFPILGWITFCDEKQITHENFKTLHDAGFNISLGSAANQDITLKTIKAAEGTGVKILINCPETRRIPSIRETVTLFRNNSNIIGYYVWDEPTAKAFDKWSEVCREILKYDSIHIPFVNLLPIAPPAQLGIDNYFDYLADFIKKSDSNVFSYDNYAIINQNGKTVVFESYYQNLEIAANVAKIYNIPFWAFCLSAPHNNYPDPTIEYLTFEAFTALAYGAQGLSYFTYSIPPETSVKFRSAPIDKENNKTNLWYLVQQNNYQIQSLSNVFLGAKLIDVWHTGKKIPKGTKRLEAPPYPFKHISSEEKGVLISLLENNGNRYLVIVNHDILNPQKVSFSASSKITRIRYNNQRRVPSDYSFSLTPGGYAIFTW